MKKLIFALTCVFCLNILSAQQKPTLEDADAANKLATDSLTNESWKSINTISLHAAYRTEDNLNFQKSIWYTVGRTNPFFTESPLLNKKGPVTLVTPEGTVTITTTPKLFPTDLTSLSLKYDLTYPVSAEKGSYSLVINGVLPLPNIGKSGLKLALTSSHNISSASSESLFPTIILNVFGGSVLSDQMARLALSYGPESNMIQTLPTYTIVSGNEKVVIDTTGLPKIANLLRGSAVEHFGYTDRAKATEIGFTVNTIKDKDYVMEQGYVFNDIERSTGLYSYEIRILLPTSTVVERNKTENVKGEVILSNIRFITVK